MEIITNIEEKINPAIRDIDEFKKQHSEAFMFFLEEYDKWRQLKQAQMPQI